MLLCSQTSIRSGRSDRCLMSLFKHDLFGKPVPTFPDHALAKTVMPILIFRKTARRLQSRYLLTLSRHLTGNANARPRRRTIRARGLLARADLCDIAALRRPPGALRAVRRAFGAD